ncbi:MAG: DnaD domain protein [Mollicutes bacterium]|nr:DnaD domain protein [Mollicutes bacterium]
MMEKVINLLRNNNINIPRLLLTKYKQLKLTEIELIVLIYILNEDDLCYNPKKISEEVNIKIEDVLEIVNNLISKDILTLEVIKKNNQHNEYLNIDNLYKKLAFFIMSEGEKREEKTNLFDIFEKEFGRTLSPIEYELINAWKDDEKYSEELIVLALKEAVFNGVTNLRYIDRILFEWKKKGIKNAADVEKERINYKGKKGEKKEIFNYDWLNDNDE